MKKIKFIFLLLPLFILCGCAAPLEINRFQPAPGQPDLTVITQANEDHLRHTDPDYTVTAVLFEARNVFVLSLAIQNRTNSRIDPADYSVGLHDGRDLKPLQQFSRDDIINFKIAYESGKPIRTGDAAVDAALTTVVKVFDPSSRSELIKNLNQAIEDYFSFRPLYPKETREGILCYHADFRLEYPLSLLVRLKEKTIAFKWLPARGKKQ
jgi:hypothetical protein